MKLGLNFGFEPITKENRRGLKTKLRVSFPAADQSNTPRDYAEAQLSVGEDVVCTLEGIASTETEKNEMVAQADNGHRRIHVSVARRHGVEGWYGIYLG